MKNKLPPLLSPIAWSKRFKQMPTIAEFLQRYRDVDAAVQKCRKLGLTPPCHWLHEIGVPCSHDYEDHHPSEPPGVHPQTPQQKGQ